MLHLKAWNHDKVWIEKGIDFLKNTLFRYCKHVINLIKIWTSISFLLSQNSIHILLFLV